MPIPLGILAVAGAGAGGGGAAFDLLETTVLGSNTASVTFSNLGDYSSTYKHLQLRVVARVTYTSNDRAPIQLYLNGDTGNSYRSHTLRGNGTDLLSQTAANVLYSYDYPYASSSGNEFAATVIDFLDAFSSSKNTTIRNLGGYASINGFNQIHLSSGVFLNTASVTSIQLLPIESREFYANSRFSLYGIK